MQWTVDCTGKIPESTPDRVKIWHKESPPIADKSYICRMDYAYIKLCHWTGSEWLDMWKPTLTGNVVEWMYIPYDE